MQQNANLTNYQIQVILSNNMCGDDLLDADISSFKKLRAEYPKATRELWRSVQKFRMAFMIPTELRPESASFSPDTNVLGMPFVGRTAAIEKALVAVQTHANIANYSKIDGNADQVRLGNSRLFAVGAPGIGKTRFAEEFPRLLAERTTDELKKKLENVRTVRLTFKSGKIISDAVDCKWKYFMDQVNWILTARAIYAVYNVKESYSNWSAELSRLLGDDLPQCFNMETFTEELLCRDPSASAIYFHFDEVQAIALLPQEVGASIIHTLSALYAKYNTTKHLTLLLFTGTMLSDIQSMLERQGAVGSPIAFPLVSLPMETLEEDQVSNIISTMKAQGKLPWLRADWQKNVPFLKLVAYTGGIPRLLELLFFAGTVATDINNMAANFATQVVTRYPMVNMQPVYDACCLALSGRHFELDDTMPNDQHQTVEKLCSNGHLFLAPGRQINVPFVYVCLTVLSEELAKGDFKDKVTDFQQKLITPTQSLVWQDFETFNLLYTMVRVKALLHLTYTTTSVKDYFHHAHTMSKNIEALEFKLVNRDYAELGHSWPASEWPISLANSHPVYTANILSTVFLNAAGAPFDGFEFVELADKQEHVIFAHQNKHTTDGQTDLTSKTIVTEYKKVQEAFKSWKMSTQASDKFDKYKNDEELIALKQATKPIVLVVFTNCRIVVDPEHPMPHENLIVINSQAHFGPFQSITRFFEGNTS